MNPHHHHHHHLPPLFVLCPCRCRRHRYFHSYHFHQHQPRLPVPPPTSTTNMTPPVLVPPTGGSSYHVQHQTWDRPEVSEARSPGFPSERSQELESTEDQVLEEDEVVFVLADEWAEFFAKSEAKRKLPNSRKEREPSKFHTVMI